ncbi:hypothetical protein MNB_SV-15-805 [hydrothermal vent metagenome]|uniref:Uncharacterized protein n=1 Tax=hydrothermal vent metagenome TaxID=652676 RepID=A0A1W1EJU6_9ZZZZ
MAYTQYSDKQIDKFHRQKYILHLEKITKNLYKMLREESTSQEQFINKFNSLKISLEKLKAVELYTTHHKEMENYITLFHQKIGLEDFLLEDIRELELANLNRLQKLKNSGRYKKDKHKKEFKNY